MPEVRSETLAFLGDFRDARGTLPEFAYNRQKFNDEGDDAGPAYGDAELATGVVLGALH
jgi:hypothetical protein